VPPDKGRHSRRRSTRQMGARLRSRQRSRLSRRFLACLRASRARPAVPTTRLRPHETDHCGPSSLNGKARRNTGNSGWEPGSTPGSFHGVSDLFPALSRQRLIADELLLQLATFLRSPDLFLELIVLTSRTLTAKQVRHDGKQDTDNPELSWSGSGACEGLRAHAIPAAGRGKHYLAIALRLFEEARDRFCWMVCFVFTVVVSVKTSRSAASQC
jgi:hypothetical protein